MKMGIKEEAEKTFSDQEGKTYVNARELLERVQAVGLDEEQQREFWSMLEAFKIIPVDGTVAERAAKFGLKEEVEGFLKKAGTH